MITTAPLPPICALLGLVALASDPASPWRPEGGRAWLLSRSCWSMALLAEAATRRFRRPVRVALPSWFCNQSLAPLRRTGASLVFMPVDLSGEADWRQAADCDLAIIVHAFGRPYETSVARAAPFLVEDCAHALRPAPGIGATGDAVLYSPHKVLGLSEGSVLAVRGAASAMMEELETRLADLPIAPPVGTWRLKRLLQSLLPDGVRRHFPQTGPSAMAADPVEGETPPLARVSVLARKILSDSDLDREAASRRDNAQALRAALAGVGGIAPFNSDDGPAPYRFVLRADSAARAGSIFAALRRARLPVETWPDLPPEVTQAPHCFGAASELRHSLLLLPVHHALPPSYATLYAEALHGC